MDEVNCRREQLEGLDWPNGQLWPDHNREMTRVLWTIAEIFDRFTQFDQESELILRAKTIQNREINS